MKAIAVSASAEGSAGTAATQRERARDASSPLYVAPEIGALQQVILRRPRLELRRLALPRGRAER